VAPYEEQQGAWANWSKGVLKIPPEDDTLDEHSSAVDSLEPSRNGRRQGWRQINDEGRQSPVRFLGHGLYIRRVVEALRRQPHGSQGVSEVYSPSTLKMMSRFVFPTSTSSVPPPCPRDWWCRQLLT
jgi:hypothetical protein